ncbi:hypothetical protein IMZ48_20460, partial [Candidatus Bathyarchaeota archaeon]|nr:hypothetical protein [Candidatus Bathyarchaeota archaeon]
MDAAIEKGRSILRPLALVEQATETPATLDPAYVVSSGLRGLEKATQKFLDRRG